MPKPRKLSVFLCHASQDKPIVRELYQRLNSEGWIDPWLDEEKLKPGQIWTATIEDAIDAAGSVIIFLSENSVSKEGFVQRELKRAWKLSTEKPENVIFLIPLRLDNCEVPRRLRSKQWGDYFGENKEKTYNSLVTSLKQRHAQKLKLESKEQARADEVNRDQKESVEKIRREKMEAYFNEAVQKQREERTLREKAEALLAEERARWNEEKKMLLSDSRTRAEADTASKEKAPLKPQSAYSNTYTFSTHAGSSILIDGAIVHFESLGRGRPVIFLHGWVGSWRYWFRSMQVASRVFRSYALDLWGFGDTSRYVLNYSLEKQSVLLEQFLNELGIRKVAIIGHGLGALVGMMFATRSPQSVDRLMAVSCPLDYSALNSRMRTASPVELTDWLASRTPEAITALADAAKADPQTIPASMAGLQADHPFGKFRDLNIPCLLVYGERDPAISIPGYETVYGWPAMIHQIYLENSGHFPMIDEPNSFDRLLMSFLALGSGLSPREIQLK